MLRRHLFMPMFAALAFCGPCEGQPASAAKPGLAVGQVWSIASPSPTTAKVVIGRLENWHDHAIVHVTVIDIPVPDDLPSFGRTTVIAHMPFDQSALVASVDQLVGMGVAANPNFEGGYDQWRTANGGVFTISVAQAIDLMFGARRGAH